MPKMIVQSQAPKMMIKPMPKHAVAPPTSQAISMTSWKFNASLPWSSTNGLESFLMSQMISGPRKPRKIDRRCASIPIIFESLSGSGPTYGPGEPLPPTGWYGSELAGVGSDGGGGGGTLPSVMNVLLLF